MIKKFKDCFLADCSFDKIGTGVSKKSNGFSNSPDECDYPFVLVFRTKDSAIQQENESLKLPKFSLQNKKRLNFR